MTQDQGTQGAQTGNEQVEVPAREDFNTEALQGSMQQILSENLGKYVVCEFLIGTQNLVQRQGYLYSVGISFIVLNDVLNDEYIVCDIFAIKFVTFLLPEDYPNVRDETPVAPTAISVGRQAQPAAAPVRANNRQAQQAAFNYAKRKSRGKL